MMPRMPPKNDSTFCRAAFRDGGSLAVGVVMGAQWPASYVTACTYDCCVGVWSSVMDNRCHGSAAGHKQTNTHSEV